MSTKTLNLTPAVYEYLLSVGVRESALLQELREETQALPGAQMQISPEQGSFMHLLIKLIGAKRCLDIGTFTGYSALSVGFALPKDGELIAFDLDDKVGAIARRYWDKAGVGGKMTLRLGPALDNLQVLIDQAWAGTVDFAFIDADKNNYDAYYELCLTLLREGGLMAIDNVLWAGRVADPNDDDKRTVAIDALNTKIHGDERVEMSMLPIGDGLTLVRKL